MTSTNIQPEHHQAKPITSEGVTLNGTGYAKVNFDNGAITFYRKSKRWIKFQSYLKGTLFTPTAKAIDANTITYQGGKYFQAHYEWWDDSVKETITLKDAPQSQKFNLSDISFLITTSEGTHVEQQANGDLWLMRTDNPRCLMVIPMPTAIDANSVSYPVAWNYNTSTHYLTITGSLTGATYPVTIDPSVNLDTAADQNATSGRCCSRDEEQRIWVSWIDDVDIEVAYSDDNGATFTGEEPWTSKDYVYQVAIAVDGNRDVHVVWVAYQNSNTYFYHIKRTHSSSTWGSVNIIIQINSGSYNQPIDILVKSDNTLYAAFYTDAFYYNGSSWSSIGSFVQGGELTVNSLPYSICCAIDPSGNLYVSYVDRATTPDRLRINKYTSSWQGSETIHAPSTYDAKGSIAIGTDSTIHCALKGAGSSANAIYYTKKASGGSWTTPTAVSTYSDTDTPIISLTQADVPIILYQTGGTDAYYRITYLKGGSWSTAEIVYPGAGSDYSIYKSLNYAYYPRCTTDKTCNIHIDGCIGATTGYTGSKYYVSFFQSTGFQPNNTCEKVYSCQGLLGSGQMLSNGCGRNIARDGSGRIWQGSCEWGASPVYKARYSDDDGKTWIDTDTGMDAPNAATASISIAIDSNRDVHIACVESSTEISYNKWTHSNSSWGTPESVTSGQTNLQTLPVLVVDSSNYPHVVWLDGSYIIKYRYKTSGGWQTAETVKDGGTTVHENPAIAIDSSDNIHLAYSASATYYVWYKKRTSGTWGNEEQVKYASQHKTTSIVVTSTGNIYISGTTGTSNTVWKKTTSWAQDNNTGGTTGDGISSLSVDQDDTVYLLYKSSGHLSYQKCTSGGSWAFVAEIHFPNGSLTSTSCGLMWAYSSDKRSIPDTGAMGVFIAETISTSYRGTYVWKSSDLTWGAGGTTSYQTVSASGTFTVTITKIPKKMIDVTEAPSVSLSRKNTLYRSISASLASTVSISRLATFKRSISASLASTVAIVRKSYRTLSVSEAATAAVSRIATFKRTISATEPPTADVSRKVTAYRTISATEPPSVSISRIPTFKRTISASATFTVEILKKSYRTISASLASTVEILKKSFRTLSVTEAATVSLSRIPTFKRTIAASATFTVEVLKKGFRTLSVTEAATVDLARKLTLYRTISATLASTVEITLRKIKQITVNATGTFTATVATKATRYRTISADLASTVSITKLSTFKRTISANLDSTVAILRKSYRTLNVTEAASVTLSRIPTFKRTLNASATFTVEVLKKGFKTINATGTFAVSILKKSFRTLNATGTFTVEVIRKMFKTIDVSATFTAALNAVKQQAVYYQTISADALFSVSISTKSTFKRTLDVVEAASVSLSRKINAYRSFSVNEAATPSLSRIPTFKRIINASATFTVAITMVKTMKRTIDASLASTVSIVRKSYRTLSVTEAATVSLSKVSTFKRTIDASIVFTVALLKKGYRTLNATATFTVEIVRKMFRTLNVSGTFTAVLNAIKVQNQYYQTISADVAFEVSVGLRKTLHVTLDAIEQASVSLNRRITAYRTLSVEEAITPTISRIVTFKRTLSADLAGSATITRTLTLYRQISAEVGNIVTLARTSTIHITLSVTEAASATLSRITTFKRTLDASIGFTTTVARFVHAYRTLDVSATFTTTIDRYKQGISYVTLEVTQAFTVSLDRVLNLKRTLDVSQVFAVSLNRLTYRILNATATFSVTLDALRQAARYYQTVSATVLFNVSLTTQSYFKRTLDATIGTLAELSRTITIYRTISATLAPTVSLSRKFFVQISTTIGAIVSLLSKLNPYYQICPRTQRVVCTVDNTATIIATLTDSEDTVVCGLETPKVVTLTLKVGCG